MSYLKIGGYGSIDLLRVSEPTLTKKEQQELRYEARRFIEHNVSRCRDYKAPYPPLSLPHRIWIREVVATKKGG